MTGDKTPTREELALLPCPFCGGEAKRIDIEEEGDNFGGSVIECTRCGASSAVHFDRKENLTDSWNCRTLPPAAAGGGWRMVPVEPTDEMIAAGWIDTDTVGPADIWAAMLAAAPHPDMETPPGA